MKKISKITLILLLLCLVGYSVTPSERLFQIGVSAERKLAGLSTKSIMIGEGEISYIEGGTGDVILFLHGFGANKDNWVRLAKHLKNDYSVIALDLPGFGNSFKDINLKYDVESQVSRVNEFINKLGITKFHIAGNSMGGYIAGNYASKYPEQVMSLWLLNTLGVQSADDSEMFKDISENKRPMVLAKNRSEFDQLISFVFANPPFMPEFVISELSKTAIKSYDLNYKIFHEVHKIDQNKISFSLPLDSELGKFSKPVLITWGRQDRVLHHSGAKVLSKIVPQSEIIIMNDIGHLPMMEAPKVTADQFISFHSRD
ncbi:alpha/beta fold hydrolase [Endozoicomonas sp. SESOKO2]|uniref:alpha/beta fold hydrolase n=1 Tax=Endozoicomonas sp. SESOKO2 TaxID=2828743 RepID=UPI0021474264|nr:alpha/beta hydrolase [Endozoicomonas sp. SESOKO2]